MATAQRKAESKGTLLSDDPRRHHNRGRRTPSTSLRAGSSRFSKAGDFEFRVALQIPASMSSRTRPLRTGEGPYDARASAMSSVQNARVEDCSSVRSKDWDDSFGMTSNRRPPLPICRTRHIRNIKQHQQYQGKHCFAFLPRQIMREEGADPRVSESRIRPFFQP